MLMLRRGLLAAAMGGGAAPAFVGAYDAIANLVHVYEPARRVLTSYTGNLVRLRRASDDAEADFGYVAATGELDKAAIAAWAGGAANVVTVYDQVGSDNITQATAGAQPLYVASAQNGHAGMLFDGTNDFLQGAFTNGGALSQPFNMFVVMQIDASILNDNAARFITDSDDLTNRLVFYKDNSQTPDKMVMGAGVDLVAVAPTANWAAYSLLYNGASSTMWLNGTGVASGNAGAQNADGITLGARLDGVLFPFKGRVVSLIICDPAHTDAQRIAMQTALNAYWQVY